MNWISELDQMLEELNGCAAVTLHHQVVEPEKFAIEPDFEADIAADGEFALDDAMREFFGQVRELFIEWSHEDLSSHGSPLVFGRLDVGSLDEICFSGYHSSEVRHMGPRDDAEKSLLLQMRHINTHSAMGDYWIALRSGTSEVPTYWWRSQAQAGTDAPLSVDFEGLIKLMFKSRGVLGWPLLAADLSRLTDEQRQSILHEPSGDAAGLGRRLAILETISTAAADARELQARLAEIVG